MKPLIITFCNADYIPVTQNWLAHLTRLNLEDSALIIALDEATTEAFHSYCQVLERPLIGGVDNLQELWVHRIVVLKELLSNGCCLIHSDSDAVWLRDPLSTIDAAGTSIVFSQGTVWPAEAHALHHVVLCCGFFYLACDQYARTFLDGIYARVRKDQDDQISVNLEVLKRISGWQIDAPYQIPFRDTYFFASRKPMLALPKSSIFEPESISILPHHAFPRLVNKINKETMVAHPLSGKSLAAKEECLRKLGIWKI